jgi:3',5'-cyclic AMP phosphodiesterase CpdA
MTIFRLTQITDTHLSRRHLPYTENFHQVCAHVGDTRPDLVVNSGDLGFDAFNNPDDLEFARAQHASLPVPCRFIPGNHDIGDNLTIVGEPPAEPASAARLKAYCALFGEDRWRFDAAGWSFIGLNTLILNTGLDAEAEQMDWLAGELARLNGQPLALFLHKPLFFSAPNDPETPDTVSRYIPQPARGRLVSMLDAFDLRLVASGHLHQRRDQSFGHTRHVWAPSTAFILNDAAQERMGIKETGLVEYTFRPDGFEVRHVRASGQVDHVR